MKVVVTDPNIFIDLVHVKLLKHLFEVNLEVHSTQDIFRELSYPDQKVVQKFINSGKLILHSCEDFDLSTIDDKGLLDLDKQALCLASHLKAFILSGDSVVIMKRRIGVHGIFWIFEKFIEKEKLSKATAIQKLKKLMLCKSPFLPNTECEKRIKIWST